MKFLIVGLIVLLLLGGGALWLFHEKGEAAAPTALAWKPQGKVAVIYCSQSKVGNTRTIAEWITSLVGGDLIEVSPVEAYPEPYGETLRKAQADMEHGVTPEITPIAHDLTEYTTVFVGSPVWYGTYAPVMKRFLSENSLAGKIVIPFATHGGGGASKMFADLKEQCRDATVLQGFSARGSNQVERRLGVGVKRTTNKDDVIQWLNQLATQTP